MSNDNVVERFLSSDKLSKTSRDQYRRQLEKWLRLSGETSLHGVIKDPVGKIALLDRMGMSLSSKKLLIVSICSLLRHNEELSLRYSAEKIVWAEELSKLNKTQFDGTSTLEPTEREVVNWVKWSDVLNKEMFLRKTEYASDRHLILSMYCLIEPCRGDFGTMRVVIDKKDAEKYDKRGENFIFLTATPGASYMVMHQYKTKRSYGRYFRYLPDVLVRIVAKNMEHNPREFLIVDTNGQPYVKKNSFIKYVNRVLEDLFQRNFTIRLLRHSCVSSIDFNTARPADLFRISKNMQHSIGMQQLYRRNVPEVGVKLEKSVEKPVEKNPEVSQLTERMASIRISHKNHHRQQFHQQQQQQQQHASEKKTKKKEKKREKHEKRDKRETHSRDLNRFKPPADRIVVL
jgi:hypothetical protein